MIIKNTEVKKLAKKYNLNIGLIPINILQQGMKVEFEHGLINKKTNVTNDNLDITFKIVLAHLEEIPDYYQRLEKMEKEGKKFWKKKINIYLT